MIYQTLLTVLVTLEMAPRIFGKINTTDLRHLHWQLMEIRLVVLLTRTNNTTSLQGNLRMESTTSTHTIHNKIIISSRKPLITHTPQSVHLILRQLLTCFSGSTVFSNNSIINSSRDYPISHLFLIHLVRKICCLIHQTIDSQTCSYAVKIQQDIFFP